VHTIKLPTQVGDPHMVMPMSSSFRVVSAIQSVYYGECWRVVDVMVRELDSARATRRRDTSARPSEEGSDVKRNV
jgi:hypothetical protein